MSMKNSNDNGNRTRDLPACSAVPQPTAPPRDHKKLVKMMIIKYNGHIEGRRLGGKLLLDGFKGKIRY